MPDTEKKVDEQKKEGLEKRDKETAEQQNPNVAKKKSRIFDLANLTNLWVAIFGGLITIILGILPFALWLDSKIDERIHQRIEPYELYLSGVNLIRDEEHDYAVTDLEKSFNLLVERKVDRKRVIPIADGYLYAIVNAEKPNKYDGNFKKLKDYLEKESSKHGWYFNEFGWYYFRTNNLNEASKNFNEAITFWNGESVPRKTAVSHWGLTLINLAEGKLKEALEEVKRASEADPKNYNFKDLVLEEEATKKDLWIQTGIKMYPNFQENLDRFFEELKKETNKTNE